MLNYDLEMVFILIEIYLVKVRDCWYYGRIIKGCFNVLVIGVLFRIKYYRLLLDSYRGLY